MKVVKQLPCLIIVLLAVMHTISCKKKSNASVNHKILTIIDSMARTGQPLIVNYYQISYYKDTSVSKILEANSPVSSSFASTTNFNYGPGKYVKTAFSPTSGEQPYTFLINNGGMIYQMSSNDYIYNFTYDNTNELLNMTVNGIFHISYDYTWSGGNISQMVYDNSLTNIYEYYPDLPFTAGDGIQLTEFLQYGRSVTRNKNLVKSIISSNPTVYDNHYYTYSFDNSYRITKMTSVYVVSIKDTLTDVYTFGY